MLNGKYTKLWRSLVTLLVGFVLIPAGGWMFNKVESMDKKFYTKSEIVEIKSELKSYVIEVKKDLSKDIDRLDKSNREDHQNIDEKLDDIVNLIISLHSDGDE